MFHIHHNIKQISGLLADTGKLSDILKYHVVKLFVKDKEHIRSFRLSNKVRPSSTPDDDHPPTNAFRSTHPTHTHTRHHQQGTLQGGKVRVQVKANPDGESFVIFNNGEAQAVDGMTDIDAVNGHIHGIDGVLTPQAGGSIPLK